MLEGAPEAVTWAAIETGLGGCVVTSLHSRRLLVQLGIPRVHGLDYGQIVVNSAAWAVRSELVFVIRGSGRARLFLHAWYRRQVGRLDGSSCVDWVQRSARSLGPLSHRCLCSGRCRLLLCREPVAEQAKALAGS